jgi:hypothetical protein
MATKKVTKRKSAKVVTKKAKAIAKVKAFKHKRVVMEPVGTESLPDMVFIASAPAWAKDIVGKRYVNADRAIAIIEALDTEKAIAKGAKAVKKEMVAAGVTPLEVVETETE